MEKLPNPHITEITKLLQLTKIDTPHDKFARGHREFKIPLAMRIVDYVSAGIVYLTAGAGAIFVVALIIHLFKFLFGYGD